MPNDNDAQPESYSVEEMLERLREGEREKEEKATGELVTRADGTQAVRVRKRKRRTEQPAKKKAEVRKSRRPLAWLLGFGLLALIALAVALVVLMGRYNSSGFRTALEERLGGLVGGDLVLDGVVVTPVAAQARSARLTWGEDRSPRALVLNDLSAGLSLGSFFSGDWSGETVQASSGELVLAGTTTPRPPAPPSGGALPFEEFTCSFMNISLGPEGRGSRFKNVELVLREGPDGGAQILWNDGEALWPGWAPLRVDRGMAEVQEGGLKLLTLRMWPKKGEGEVEFSGRRLLREGEDVELAVKMTDFPLGAVMGPSLGRLLEATVSAEEGGLVLDGASLGESELRIGFTGTSAVLQNLPFLHILHTRLGDTEFVRPQFREIRGVFVRDGTATRLQDLELSAPYLMKVRGHLEVDAEGGLSGRLEVGITEDKIINSTNRKKSTVFSDPEGGFCWVTITLDGTVDDPIDDLQGLLQQAAREAAARANAETLRGRNEE